jgi:glucose/arabinose dehydrogenase
VALAVAGCGGGSGGAPLADVLIAAREPSALAVAPDGTLYVTERATGRLLALAPGTRSPRVIARFDVGSAQAQRGLLGVAVSGDGKRLYVDGTDGRDGRIVVWSLAAVGGPATPIWRGPVSADKGNGGHLVVLPNGHVVVGVGGLDASLASLGDPRLPNGKLLELAPEGPETQRPRVVSGGWTNPFALAVGAAAALYVGDNAVGTAKERLGRSPAGPFYRWPETVVPAGLAVLPGKRLAVCEYARAAVETFTISGSSAPRSQGILARGCRTAIALAPGGRTLYLADLAGVRSVALKG